MNNSYTGRRQIWKQKFSHNINLFDIIEVPISIDEQVLRYVPKPFNEIIQNEVLAYSPNYTNIDNDNIVDSNLLKWSFKSDTPFENNNPYKFLSQIMMNIDKITFETYNFYDPANPTAGRGSGDLNYQQIEELFPIKLKINGNELSFGGTDAFYQTQIEEYGYTDTGGQTDSEKPIFGGIYIEAQDKQFELSAIPKSFNLELDLNGTLRTETLKTQAYRRYHYNNVEAERIDKFLYGYMFTSVIRIEGTIESTIDYTALDNKRLSAPKRTIDEPISLNNIEKMLKKLLPEKEKPELEFIQAANEEDIQNIIDQFINDKLEPQRTDIIQKIKENAEIIYN